MNIISEAKVVIKDASYTTLTLLKIMIPISIIVKILGELGLIRVIGNAFGPFMGLIGLPGEFGLVWATAMITNIYGGLVVFFSLSLQNSYTVAQVTVLSTVLLLAHNLPIEGRIAQKAGIRLWFTLFLRIMGAVLLGSILSYIFNTLNLHKEKSILLWRPDFIDPSLISWIFGELRNYIMIFLIITGLLILMRVLKKTGIIDRLNDLLQPGLRRMGISKNATPLTIIGVTLGLAYGGGLIIQETKLKIMSKKDVVLSLSLMGLSHSLIEDTLLMLVIGASLSGIFFGRIFFTVLIILVLIWCLNHISEKTFDKYFVNY